MDSIGFELALAFLVIAAVAVAWAMRCYCTSRDRRRDCTMLKRDLEAKDALLVQTNARLSHRSTDLAQAYSFLSAEITERQQAELELDRVQKQNHASHHPAAVNESAIDALKRAAKLVEAVRSAVAEEADWLEKMESLTRGLEQLAQTIAAGLNASQTRLDNPSTLPDLLTTGNQSPILVLCPPAMPMPKNGNSFTTMPKEVDSKEESDADHRAAV